MRLTLVKVNTMPSLLVYIYYSSALLSQEMNAVTDVNSSGN